MSILLLYVTYKNYDLCTFYVQFVYIVYDWCMFLVFRVDYESQYERRQFLAARLLPDDGDEGRLRFTVVAEPEEDEADCKDVGVAFVSLPQILEDSRDLEDEDVASEFWGRDRWRERNVRGLLNG